MCNWLNILSDMEKRTKNPTYPHINMSFKDFCDGTMDSTKIQCILDCPSNDGEKPSVIKYVFFKKITIQLTKSCLIDLLMKVTPRGINNRTSLTVEKIYHWIYKNPLPGSYSITLSTIRSATTMRMAIQHGPKFWRASKFGS